MPNEKILVIEDEPDIVELLEYNLSREGFRCLTCRDGESGLSVARERAPDLILLDLMLPGMDGLEVCRELRSKSETRVLPVIMLTAKGEESDVVLGLGMGADDYITKPFSTKELVARVRAGLRRGKMTESGEERSRLEHGDVVLDQERHEVRVEGDKVDLTRAEFRLLHALMRRPGRVFSRSELVDQITAGESIILDRNVDVHISSMRKKLGPASDIVATVRGVGYKCVD